MPSTCIGRRLETIFCYPPQVATNGETASISGRGSPEMALAAPPEQGQEYYLLRFCENLGRHIKGTKRHGRNKRVCGDLIFLGMDLSKDLDDFLGIS